MSITEGTDEEFCEKVAKCDVDLFYKFLKSQWKIWYLSFLQIFSTAIISDKIANTKFWFERSKLTVFSESMELDISGHVPRINQLDSEYLDTEIVKIFNNHLQQAVKYFLRQRIHFYLIKLVLILRITFSFILLIDKTTNL